MAVMLHRGIHTSRELGSAQESGKIVSFSRHVKHTLELDLSPRDGSKVLFGHTDDYLSSPAPLHGMNRVEVPQLVPEFSSDSRSILDLSAAGMSPTLDTPSIIDSIVDALPFRFNNPSGVAPDPIPPPGDIVSLAAASAMLGIEDPAVDTFQDITPLIRDSHMPLVSHSPGPLLSPTDSTYSDITVSSPASLPSAASTSSDTTTFFPDFEILPTGSSIKMEVEVCGTSSKDNRYVEMRRRNNIASRRSRLSRREKEREMEQQMKFLNEENASLKAKVKTLEELVDKTKKIILEAFTKRQQQH